MFDPFGIRLRSPTQHFFFQRKRQGYSCRAPLGCFWFSRAGVQVQGQEYKEGAGRKMNRSRGTTVFIVAGASERVNRPPDLPGSVGLWWVGVKGTPEGRGQARAVAPLALRSVSRPHARKPRCLPRRPERPRRPRRARRPSRSGATGSCGADDPLRLAAAHAPGGVSGEPWRLVNLTKCLGGAGRECTRQ